MIFFVGKHNLWPNKNSENILNTLSPADRGVSISTDAELKQFYPHPYEADSEAESTAQTKGSLVITKKYVCYLGDDFLDEIVNSMGLLPSITSLYLPSPVQNNVRLLPNS